MSTPASVGPMAEADMMTSAFTPIAEPILCGGMTSSTIANMSGSTSPVPRPCTARPTSAIQKLVANALANAPTRNATRAKIAILRAENQRVSRPENGIAIPMTSM